MKKQITIHLNIFMTVAKTCEKVLRCLRLKVEHIFNNKNESSKISFLNEKSYNKTVVDFNFGRHKVFSTRKSKNSQRPLGRGEYHFKGR